MIMCKVFWRSTSSKRGKSKTPKSHFLERFKAQQCLKANTNCNVVLRLPLLCLALSLEEIPGVAAGHVTTQRNLFGGRGGRVF